jgi:hypothetical protein
MIVYSLYFVTYLGFARHLGDGVLDLMIFVIDNSYIHNSGLQAVTALSLIYTLYSSPLHRHILGVSAFVSRIQATDL